ncbi:MAG TPA: hypothetical protein VLS52_05985 [Rudaea sp.]|nr:hypothetical protein [Rudaea sp.]
MPRQILAMMTILALLLVTQGKGEAAPVAYLLKPAAVFTCWSMAVSS